MRLLRGCTLAVLVVLVGGGWYGGLRFVTDPSGAGLGMTTAAIGALLVLWMLGQVVAIGLTFPGMQLGFLAVGLLLTALGSAGLRLDEFRARDRS